MNWKILEISDTTRLDLHYDNLVQMNMLGRIFFLKTLDYWKFVLYSCFNYFFLEMILLSRLKWLLLMVLSNRIYNLLLNNKLQMIERKKQMQFQRLPSHEWLAISLVIVRHQASCCRLCMCSSFTSKHDSIAFC